MSSPRHAAPSRVSVLGARAGRAVARVTMAGSVGAGLVAAAGTAPAHAEDNVWDRMAMCEASGNWFINTGNGYYGGLQFSHSTWKAFGGQSYATYAHQATKLQQITIAQKVLKGQGPGAWPVCSVRAGLNMTNGLAPYPGQDGSTAPTSPAPAPSTGTSGTWTVVASAGANIRSGPSTSYSIVGGAAFGTKITGTLSNGWVRIDSGRYISAATLTTGSTSTAPASSTMAPLVVDGSRGPLTVKAIQLWVGMPQTGVWDVTTVKALQRKVGVTADGSWGPASQAALQTRIGMTRDGSGYMNYRTVYGLQKWLNANVIG